MPYIVRKKTVDTGPVHALPTPPNPPPKDGDFEVPHSANSAPDEPISFDEPFAPQQPGDI